MSYEFFLQTAAERLNQIIIEIPPGHGNITSYLVRAYIAGGTPSGFNMPFEKIVRDLEDRVARIDSRSSTSQK